MRRVSLAPAAFVLALLHALPCWPRPQPGVDWHLSGDQPARRTGSGTAANP